MQIRGNNVQKLIKKQYRIITYCLHRMSILQHVSLFQICNAVTISSEIKSLPFHTVAPNLHKKGVHLIR